MDEPLTLLKACLSREKQLSKLRENVKENAVVINELSSALRDDYRKILTRHPQFSSTTKDVDGMLWKQCFYKPIEEFRSSIRKAVQIIEENGANATKASAFLLRLGTALNKFLFDSAVFYQELLIELESMYKKTSPNNSGIAIIRCIHRCLLYLGDLARYKELYSEAKQKNYREAERYYERAAFLIPSSGNPQNQLAVLATYVEAECIAVYHYCRSLLVPQPFASGIDNLSLLFEKNARSVDSLQKGGGVKELTAAVSASAQAAGVSATEKAKRVAAVRAKFFLMQFIQLQGVLFKWTRALEAHLKKDHMVQPSAEDLSSLDLDVDSFLSQTQHVLEEYDHLLVGSTFGDQLLVRLLVISIFSVHHSAALLTVIGDCAEGRPIASSTGFSGAASIKPCTETHPHTVAESLSLVVLFGLVKRVAVKIDAVQEAEKEKVKKSAMKLLPVLSVFTDWASRYPRYLVANNAPIPRETTTNTSMELGSIYALASAEIVEEATDEDRRGYVKSVLVFSDAELRRSEARARSGMRTAFSCLRELLEGASPKGPGLSRCTAEASLPLREHIELRGFLPLADLYEGFFKGADALSKPPTPPSDEVVRDRRLLGLQAFLHDWLVPAALREAADAENARHKVAAQTRTKQQSESVGEAGKRGGLLNREKALSSLAAEATTAAAAAAAAAERGESKQTSRRKKSKGADRAPETVIRNGKPPRQEPVQNDFPPLPLKKSESSQQVQAHASSALFQSRAPDHAVDPFRDDDDGTISSKEMAEEARDHIVEDEGECKDDEPVDVASFLRPPDSSSDFGFLYCNASSSSSPSLLSSAVGESVGATISFPSMSNTINLLQHHQQFVFTAHSSTAPAPVAGAAAFTIADEDIDDVDDVVVFRPAFSRLGRVSSSPSLLSGFHMSPDVGVAAFARPGDSLLFSPADEVLTDTGQPADGGINMWSAWGSSSSLSLHDTAGEATTPGLGVGLGLGLGLGNYRSVGDLLEVSATAHNLSPLEPPSYSTSQSLASVFRSGDATDFNAWWQQTRGGAAEPRPAPMGAQSGSMHSQSSASALTSSSTPPLGFGGPPPGFAPLPGPPKPPTHAYSFAAPLPSSSLVFPQPSQPLQTAPQGESLGSSEQSKAASTSEASFFWERP